MPLMQPAQQTVWQLPSAKVWLLQSFRGKHIGGALEQPFWMIFHFSYTFSKRERVIKITTHLNQHLQSKNQRSKLIK